MKIRDFKVKPEQGNLTDKEFLEIQKLVAHGKVIQKLRIKGGINSTIKRFRNKTTDEISEYMRMVREGKKIPEELKYGKYERIQK